MSQNPYEPSNLDASSLKSSEPKSSGRRDPIAKRVLLVLAVGIGLNVVAAVIIGLILWLFP